MATKKKMLQAAAGSAGGAGLDITDVFSTYLYEGTGSTQTITNGNDLDGEGGLVWIKSRSSSSDHFLFDTERGPQKRLITNATLGEYDLSSSGGLSAFNADGFNIGSYAGINSSAVDYASWTFRKAPKFFDVVTYTGDGVQGREIAHNLGSVPGMMIVKRLEGAGYNWNTYHRSMENYEYIRLNTTDAKIYAAGNAYWDSTDPTSSVFTLGNHSQVNLNGGTYVAYLFAHNDGDGEFGPDSDQDVIKCGSYTGNGSSNGPEIDLGFEPQWLLIKEVDATGNWQLFDSMRGMVANGIDARIAPNLSNAEDSIQSLTPTATGFKINTTSGNLNTNNSDHIYMAIRRGPLAVPTDATKVFATDTSASSTAQAASPPVQYYSGFPVDMMLLGGTFTSTGANYSHARLTNGRLRTDSTVAETVVADHFDTNQGYRPISLSANSSYIAHLWKRAPGYFDVVAYTGNGTGGNRLITHNLGVAPEMIWAKRRNGTISWSVLTPNNKHMILNGIHLEYQDANTNSYYWGDGGGASGVVTAPTDTGFTVGPAMNGNNQTYIAYLFATAPGVSKVGSYTGNGSSQTINCGFTSGARFILIKRTDSTGDWYLWDTSRGIVAGNDPHLSLNTTAAQVTTDDSIDPASSGFIVNQVTATNINVSSADYIFYAIA